MATSGNICHDTSKEMDTRTPEQKPRFLRRSDIHIHFTTQVEEKAIDRRNMQSRVAASCATRLLALATAQKQRLGCCFATTTGRTADPAIHAVEPEEVDANEAIRDQKLRNLEANETISTPDDQSYNPPKSPIESAPKLESPPVGPWTNPIRQQKRRSSNYPAVEEMSCEAIDGGPWPDDEKSRGSDREEQSEDDKEYFRHHKASPLSEIEIADTRKPVTRATDETMPTPRDMFGYEVGGVILWRPEQLDTAEDSLRRAREIFLENAMKGDPDSPHGRVLRQLRGEYW